MRVLLHVSALVALALELPAQSIAPLTIVVEGVARNVSVGPLREMPRETASVTFHDQPAMVYEGYALHAILRSAGVRADSLRGPALAMRIVAEAAGGFRVVLALADLDSSLGARRVLLADRVNGRPLPADEAPAPHRSRRPATVSFGAPGAQDPRVGRIKMSIPDVSHHVTAP